MPHYVQDLGHIVGFEYFRIQHQINDLEDPFKNLVKSEISMIFPKIYSVTVSGYWLNFSSKYRSGHFVQEVCRIIDPKNMFKISDSSVIPKFSVHDQISYVRSVQDFGRVKDLNFFLSSNRKQDLLNEWNHCWNRKSHSIYLSDFSAPYFFQNLAQTNDLKISTFMINWVIPQVLSGPSSIQRLWSLWCILNSSWFFVWKVFDFPGKIRCVLRGIRWKIYCHNLSIIVDRSLISIFSEFIIRSVFSEKDSCFLWERRSWRSLLKSVRL